MKTKNGYFLAVIFGAVACSDKDSLPQETRLDDPKTIHVYCQGNPDRLLRTIQFEYRRDGKPIRETTSSDHAKMEKSYVYNDAGQPTKTIQHVVYYDSEGQPTSTHIVEERFSYQGDKLVREDHDWGGFTTYAYERNKLVSKKDHTKHGDLHHITTYHYSKDRLAEERKETVAGSLMYSRIMHYDLAGRLIRITEGENTVENNSYEGNRLIEKRTYYFGIDPGFDPCYGNYLHVYMY